MATSKGKKSWGKERSWYSAVSTVVRHTHYQTPVSYERVKRRTTVRQVIASDLSGTKGASKERVCSEKVEEKKGRRRHHPSQGSDFNTSPFCPHLGSLSLLSNDHQQEKPLRTHPYRSCSKLG